MTAYLKVLKECNIFYKNLALVLNKIKTGSSSENVFVHKYNLAWKQTCSGL